MYHAVSFFSHTRIHRAIIIGSQLNAVCYKIHVSKEAHVLSAESSIFARVAFIL